MRKCGGNEFGRWKRNKNENKKKRYIIVACTCNLLVYHMVPTNPK